MTVLNNLDRYQLAFDAIRRIPRLQSMVGKANEQFEARIQKHKEYVMEHGEDLPEVRNWKWQS
jgi:xylulose-5-phosphate/fructose-6-phosphate phosphoketolase